MKYLLAGAAIAALTAIPLAAQGNGHGKGQSGAHGGAAHGPSMHGPANKGPDNKSAGHGNAGHASGSMASAMQTADHGHGKGKASAGGHGPDKGNAAAKKGVVEHGRPAIAHSAKPAPHALSHGKANDVTRVASERPNPGHGVKVLKDGRRYYSGSDARETLNFAAGRRGVVDGCPPGLVKKNNGCLPPGLAKQRAYRADWWGISNAPGGRYAYDNGYLLRFNGDRVAGYVPLLGGALSPGNIWPSYYAPMTVPRYYVDYYDLGQPGGYRYADNVLYRVDPTTAAITSVAALLTGDTFRVGSAMPPGYGVYNVPYSYRSQYVDGPNSWYRYSDGYVYQVDPTTQLVTAAIELLAS